MPTAQLSKCLSYLADNGYLLKQKDRYLLTSKFNQEVLGLDIGVTVVERKDLIVKEPSKTETTDWVKEYQQFIIDAKIPKYSTSGRGETYEINRATKPGREAYKKARLSGVTNEQLKFAASAYYSQGRGKFRVKIETFFVDEHWRNIDVADTDTRSDDGSTITSPNLG